MREIKSVSYNYSNYRDLVIELSEKNECTGEISAEHVAATKINAQRMKRLDKQIILNDKIKAALKINKQWTWVILIESWCGDGAQNLPIIAKIAELSPNIELKILLRDQNPTLMDKYLTNGSKSIPKLICYEKGTEREIGIWGPRPKAIQEMVNVFKSNNPNISHDEFVKNLHLWYAQNKAEALQEELTQLISEWGTK